MHAPGTSIQYIAINDKIYTYNISFCIIIEEIV